jgi:MFS family permease
VISKGRQWLLVAILTSVSMLAMIDKNLLQLMVDPIKADLGLSDVQISLILGAAFALANLAASLPAGWLADRGNRSLIIGSGVVIWSVATAASGADRKSVV